jgi:predicted metalloprotease with PDZ domain
VFLTWPRAGWQEIEDGFGRGRVSGGRQPLAEESRRMHETHAYHRVYWAGAAVALMADVELRRRSGGARSLDDAMRRVAALRVDPGRWWTAADLVAEVDRHLGGPTVAPIAARALASSAFPDLSATYAWLGLFVRDDDVEFVSAPGAAMRDAIMARTR